MMKKSLNVKLDFKFYKVVKVVKIYYIINLYKYNKYYYIYIMSYPYIPKELLHIILEYDGKIKYRNGIYINSINKNDYRYKMLIPIIKYKLESLNYAQIIGTRFYFEINFSNIDNMALCYDYNFSWKDCFEICFFRLSYDRGLEQIRTIIY